MGGIIGKFFHEFGITIVAAVLISMFVSFTLDPMLSSIWHDPQAHGVHRGPPVTRYDRTIGRVTGCVRPLHRVARRRLPGHPALVAGAQAGDPRLALATFVASFFMVPLLGTEFVPKADFSETADQLLHAGRLVARSDRGQGAAGRRDPARAARSALHRHHHQHRPGRGQDLRRRLRAPGRPQGPPAQRRRADRAAARAAGAHARHHGDPRRRSPTWAAARACSSRCRAPTWTSSSACRRRSWPSCAAIPGLVDLDSTLKPDKPTVAIDVRRDAASDLGLNVNALADRAAHAGGRHDGGQLARARRPELRRQRAPGARQPQRDRRPAAPADQRGRRGRRLARASCGCRRWPTCAPSTGPNQINRRDLNREINVDANAFGRSSGEVSADIRKVLDEHQPGRPATATASAARPRT